MVVHSNVTWESTTFQCRINKNIPFIISKRYSLILLKDLLITLVNLDL